MAQGQRLQRAVRRQSYHSMGPTNGPVERWDLDSMLPVRPTWTEWRSPSRSEPSVKVPQWKQMYHASSGQNVEPDVKDHFGPLEREGRWGL